ncbi:hypothetical protein ACVBEH_17115 [Roseateles sp. GG27B]
MNAINQPGANTPGPWIAERGCIFAGEVSIAQVFSGAVATQAEANSNAQLLASAPALLAALVYLRGCIESGIEPGMGKINDAIRQARSAA